MLLRKPILFFLDKYKPRLFDVIASGLSTLAGYILLNYGPMNSAVAGILFSVDIALNVTTFKFQILAIGLTQTAPALQIKLRCIANNGLSRPSHTTSLVINTHSECEGHSSKHRKI